jgi:glycosyltransferase involved in cell wall biosynthesis
MSLRPLGEKPLCSIIIPCLDEEAFIEDVVHQAAAQRYPADKIEILVVDGGSRDKTRAMVAALAARDSRIGLIDNPGRIQAAAMNLGIKRSHGEVIVRLDAHAEYAEDYVAQSVTALRRTGALNVGGAARARAKTDFQRAVCAALESPLGVGGSAYRDPSREGFVESVWGGAFRREAFELVGLYDAEAKTNEDAELNQRIIEAGGTVYLSRDVVAFYYPRGSLAAVSKQYFSYGEGRARTLLRHGRALSLRPYVPATMVVGFVILLFLAIFLHAAAVLLAFAAAAYVGGVALESLRLAARHGLGVFPKLVTIFPTMHLSHGLGFWSGLRRTLPAGIQDREPERIGPLGA